MQYFKSLPKIVYNDKYGVSTLYTNLLARVNIVPDLLTNTLNFYSYDIQDGDTPEIVAHKYYDDVSRFWIVLYCNQMLDPQWDWPLSQKLFNKYIQNEYGLSKDSLHHYEKVYTKTSHGTDNDQTVEERFVIGEEEYLNTPNTTVSYTLPTGRVDITTETKTVSNYDYELEMNEKKRSIKLLNKLYADQLETEFKKLMS